MAFTQKLPVWLASGVEPPEILKNEGWKAGIKPPDAYFNYLQNTAYLALKELQEKAAEASALAGKVDKEVGKGLSTNDYTTAEKTKLGGIATGANNYTHPATHPPSIIVQDANNRFMTDAERTKLQGIQAGATNYQHPTTHPATMITEDATHRFATDAEKTSWNAKETPAGSKAKVDALAGVGNTKTVKQLDEEVAGVKETVATHSAEIASQDVGKGASLVGFKSTEMTATNVNEAILETFMLGNSKKQDLVDKLLLVDDSLPITQASTWAEVIASVNMISTGKKWKTTTVKSATNFNGHIVVSMSDIEFYPRVVTATKITDPQDGSFLERTGSGINAFNYLNNQNVKRSAGGSLSSGQGVYYANLEVWTNGAQYEITAYE